MPDPLLAAGTVRPDAPSGVPADPPPSEPAVGREFAGFRLAAELGSGAFARVYLGHQPELAGRPVVLKVASGPAAESHLLAQLQHTNIVPVYSVHAAGRYHAICMPFFGATTLADVLDAVRRNNGPPADGGLLVRTLLDRRREVARAVGGGPHDPPPHAREQLDRLAAGPHADAVLGLAAGLADGLHHAHERGIAHRDLKPANVLLTDEGRPMLLDFNMAGDSALGGRVGGTVRYMAPEHLAAHLGQDGRADAGSDLYAVGLILFELLAGQAPFPLRAGPGRRMVDALLDARRAGPPPLRPLNPRVSPAAEAVVLKLLAPDPRHRYPSAGALREDLLRHLADKPLRFAPNPSVRERANKWVRRHPRWASAGTVGGLAGVLLAVAGLLVWAGVERARDAAAADRFRQFRAEKGRLEAAIGAGLADPAVLPAEVANGRTAVERYAANSDPLWQDRPDVRRLPEADRAAVRQEVGELLLLTALAAGKLPPDPAVLTVAAGECDRAAGLLADPGAAALARATAFDLRGRAAGRPPEPPAPDGAGPLAAHLLAFDRFARGEFRQAAELAERAVAGDPTGRPSAWFVLGLARHRLHEVTEAEAALGIALALGGENDRVRFNRGLVRYARGRLADARADFDACVRLRPEEANGWLNRAAVRNAADDPAGAADDLSSALAAGGDPARVLLFRAQVNRRLKRAEAAAADLQAGLAHTPRDALGWMARAVGRRAADPAGSLADFDEALRLDPRQEDALLGRASLLAEDLGRPADAVATLGRLLALNPRHTAARPSRAVLLARLGDRPAAHADAQAALAVSREPEVVYQVAGAYALTSANRPDDRAEALRLLTEALRKGYGRQYLATDPDLRPLRDTPEFRALLAAWTP